MLLDLKTQSWEGGETKARQGPREAYIERALWRLAEGTL